MDNEVLLARYEALVADFLRVYRALKAHRDVLPWLVRATSSEGPGSYEVREAARLKLYDFMDNPDAH